MLFDVHKDVSAKQRAVDLDFELSQTTHQFKALKLQAPPLHCDTLPQRPEESSSPQMAPRNSPTRTQGRNRRDPNCGQILMYTGRLGKAKQLQPNKFLLQLVYLAAWVLPSLGTRLDVPVFEHSPVNHGLSSTSMLGSRSIGLHYVQRMFVAWLLMSTAASRVAVIELKFNSWTQLACFHGMIAESLGLEKLKGHPHSAMLRTKPRSIVVRHLTQNKPGQYSRSLLGVERPELVGDSIDVQPMGALAGFALRQPQLQQSPQMYLNNARQTLLLDQRITFEQKECIRMSVANEYCELLPDRPHWIRTPLEPIWPGKCRIRAGAEPTGYHGRLWSKEELFKGKRKASESRSLPRNLVKRKQKRLVRRLMRKTKAQREQHSQQNTQSTFRAN